MGSSIVLKWSFKDPQQIETLHLVTLLYNTEPRGRLWASMCFYVPFTPVSIPPSVSMLRFSYIVLQYMGSGSPQAPYKCSLSFKHTEGLAYFPLSPGRLTTCQRHAAGEQDLRLAPLLSWLTPLPAHMLWGFVVVLHQHTHLLKPSSPGNSISNRAHLLVVSGCGIISPPPPHTNTSLLYFYQAPCSSHLLLPGNPIQFGVCDEGHSPSPHWSRAPL